jgi:hypothetical protein
MLPVKNCNRGYRNKIDIKMIINTILALNEEILSVSALPR